MGCATQRPAPKLHVTITNDEADVYEAVFRYQFARRQSAGTFFIQIQDADPTPEFLLRFSGQTPAVKPASEARFGRHSIVYDCQTRKESLIFDVGAIHWNGKKSAEVSGGYQEADLSASSNTYQLIRHGGQWRVVKDTMNWIADARTSTWCNPRT